MARNPGSSDGSAPVIGELPKAGPRPPRRPRRGDQMTGLVIDPTSSPEMRAHNAAATAAAAAYNAGGIDSDGAGPVPGLNTPTPPGGSGVTGSGNTWADPSSQG